MAEKKKYLVNCDVCDMRKASPESLAGYEQIMINADLLLADARSREMMNTLPIVCNVDHVLDVEGEVTIVVNDGDFELRGGMEFEERTILCINGNLSIGAGAQKAMEHIFRCLVNGNVRYTQDMEPFWGKLLVNGRVSCLPADCVALKPEFTVDRYFPLRAKENGTYFAEDRVLMTEEGVDLKALAAKHVRFLTRQLVVREEDVSDAVGMFDENVELHVIPRGFVYAGSGVKLEDSLIKKYGRCLYVDGDLTLEPDSAACLNMVERLYVEGNVRLTRSLTEEFERVDVAYKSLIEIKGRSVRSKVQVSVDQAMLDASPDGVEIANCARVQIDGQVDPQAILNGLEIKNCAQVTCVTAQQGAVELVCRNVAKIVVSGHAKDGDADEIETMFAGLWGDAETKVVNADTYCL